MVGAESGWHFIFLIVVGEEGVLPSILGLYLLHLVVCLYHGHVPRLDLFQKLFALFLHHLAWHLLFSFLKEEGALVFHLENLQVFFWFFCLLVFRWKQSTKLKPEIQKSLPDVDLKI